MSTTAHAISRGRLRAQARLPFPRASNGERGGCRVRRESQNVPPDEFEVEVVADAELDRGISAEVQDHEAGKQRQPQTRPADREHEHAGQPGLPRGSTIRG